MIDPYKLKYSYNRLDVIHQTVYDALGPERSGNLASEIERNIRQWELIKAQDAYERLK